MKEIIDWLDRENARQDIIEDGIEAGFITADDRCLIARHLSRDDSVPAVLKEALRDCD